MKNETRATRLAARCAARAAQVETLADGTIVVPSVSRDHNSTVAAWARYLGVDLAAARMMIVGREPGRCWIKNPRHLSVIAYG